MADLFSTDELTGLLIGSGVIILLGIGLYWLALRVGHRLVTKAAGRDEESEARAETLWMVSRRVVLLVIVITGILLLFQVWGFSLTPFLAMGTVLAAAVGFGAQDLVKDFIGGFFIVTEDQFHIGDTVTIAGTTGTVQDIQLRVTVLRDVEGNVHFVPNGQITVASNFTSQFAQPLIDVGISYESDVDHVLAVMKRVLDELADDPAFSSKIRADSEIMGVNKLDDSAVVIRGRMTTSAEDRWAVRREALRRIKKAFDAEGVTIAYPQVTIHRGE